MEIKEPNENGILKVHTGGRNLATTTQKYYNKLALMYHETKQIRDLAIDDIDQWRRISMALNQCCLLIGSASVLSDGEYNIMKDFLITEYKDFSAEELLIAFKKVSSGAITVEMQHFGKLSPMYLGAVLKAFRDERHKALALEERNKPKAEPTPPTEEEKLKIRRDYIYQCIIKPFVAMKYGTNNFKRSETNHLFRFLFNRKLIEPSAEELAEYKNKALAEMTANAHQYTRNTKEKNLARNPAEPPKRLPVMTESIDEDCPI